MRTKVILSLVAPDDKVEEICKRVHIPVRERERIESYHNKVIKGEKATIMTFPSQKDSFIEQLNDVLDAGQELSGIPCDAHIGCYFNSKDHWVFSPEIFEKMAKTGIEINIISTDLF